MFRATRSAVTVARAARGFSTATNQASNEFLTERAAAKAHAAGAFEATRAVVCYPETRPRAREYICRMS
jgi:hypothetical protein